MLVHRHEPGNNNTISTVGGEWSGNTENFVAGSECMQVYVKSLSTNTTFTLTITDRNNVEIRKYSGVTQLVNDLTPFLVKGIVTLAITSATKDEAFIVQCYFKE